eukprot:6474867-Pyramimonas_sp.AAC.1
MVPRAHRSLLLLQDMVTIATVPFAHLDCAVFERVLHSSVRRVAYGRCHREVDGDGVDLLACDRGNGQPATGPL